MQSIKKNKFLIAHGFAVLNVYTLIAFAYCVFFLTVFYLVSINNFLAVLHFLALLGVTMNYFILQFTKNFKKASNVILGIGAFVVVSMFASGGWEGTGYLWTFAFLPFAFLRSNRKEVLKWNSIVIIGCILSVVLHFLNVIRLPYSYAILINCCVAIIFFAGCIFLSQKATMGYQEFWLAEKNEGIILEEKKFRSLVENSSESISMLNEDFVPVYCSPSAEEITGYPFEERLLLGSGIECAHPDDREKLKSSIRDVKQYPGNKIPVSFRTRHKAGHYIWLEGMMVNLLHDENVHAIVFNFRDVTGKKNSEQRQALYDALVNSSDDAIISKCLNGVFTSWNNGAKNMFGYTSEEIIGQSVMEADFPDSLLEEQEVMERIKRKEQVEHYETKKLRKDGTLVFLSITVSPIKDTEGNMIGISKIARDITKRKLAEEEVNKLNEELRLLVEHVQKSREEERKYIAREIHDELGQALTALKIDVSMLKKKVITEGSINQTFFTGELDSVIDKINKSIESVKRIATDLRPEILDHLDIIDAIKWQAQLFENITGIKCDVSQLPDHLDLGASFSVTVYRTVQEALTNITRHANASVVRILIEKDSKKLLVEINDNGKGIKEVDIKSMKSLGLIGIRERVMLLNGNLSITGQPDKGTTVAVQIPI